jgi:ribosomal protein S18 acetylase RimI-like enzyme
MPVPTLRKYAQRIVERPATAERPHVNYRLRPAGANDREFLFALHCETMRSVIEQTWGWDEEWQRRDFEQRFGTYAASVIEVDRQAVGGLLLQTTLTAVDIIELQILPAHQGKGTGTSVLERVIGDAAHRSLAITLSVVPANPRAKRLYERLGFEVTGVDEPFIRMRYRP